MMGMAGGNAADSSSMASYWGRDPVHPLDIAYANMAKKILEEVNEEAVVNARRPTSQQAATDRPTTARRERWTEAAPTVASQTGKWSHGGKYGGGGGGEGSSSSAMPHSKRGRGNRGGAGSGEVAMAAARTKVHPIRGKSDPVTNIREKKRK